MQALFLNRRIGARLRAAIACCLAGAILMHLTLGLATLVAASGTGIAGSAGEAHLGTTYIVVTAFIAPAIETVLFCLLLSPFKASRRVVGAVVVSALAAALHVPLRAIGAAVVFVPFLAMATVFYAHRERSSFRESMAYVFIVHSAYNTTGVLYQVFLQS